MVTRLRSALAGRLKKLRARAASARSTLKDNAGIVLEVGGFGLLSGGVGWIYGPAGLIVGGLLVIVSIERTVGLQRKAELAERIRRQSSGIPTS